RAGVEVERRRRRGPTIDRQDGEARQRADDVDGEVVDDASVHEVPAAVLDGHEQARESVAGAHGWDERTRAEHQHLGALDVDGGHGQRDAQFLEGTGRVLGQQFLDTLVAEQAAGAVGVEERGEVDGPHRCLERNRVGTSGVDGPEYGGAGVGGYRSDAQPGLLHGPEGAYLREAAGAAATEGETHRAGRRPG